MTVTVPTAFRTMDSAADDVVAVLLGTLAVARRIPALGPVIDALRRTDIGDRAAVPVVAQDKLRC